MDKRDYGVVNVQNSEMHAHQNNFFLRKNREKKSVQMFCNLATQIINMISCITLCDKDSK